MTPEDLDNALQSAALTYVREVKQQEVPKTDSDELPTVGKNQPN